MVSSVKMFFINFTLEAETKTSGRSFNRTDYSSMVQNNNLAKIKPAPSADNLWKVMSFVLGDDKEILLAILKIMHGFRIKL